MSRSDAYYQMLQAVSQLQLNIALILEAKAAESSRSSQWICRHLNSDQFELHSDQLKRTLEVHEHLIEVIDGMTKMEAALAKNLQALVGQQEEESMGGAGGLGALFPFGGSLT